MREIVTFVFGLALLGNAALFVPQAIAVWRKKSDQGISLVTFGGFCILQVIGVVHGVYEHDNSLIIGLGASFLTCGTVTFLTLVYRIRRLRATVAAYRPDRLRRGPGFPASPGAPSVIPLNNSS
jgi:MtN3 and saliva related transmembrane protein